MRIFFALLALCSLSSHVVWGQNLLEERIRKLSSRKKSVYLNRGVFHNGGPKSPSVLKAVRHSYSSSRGYERIVFDFETQAMPRLYGYIAGDQNKVYVDFFEVSPKKALSSFGESKFVKSLNFFPLTEETLSVEIIFKKNVSIDIFYLDSPARLVIDVKA